MARRALDLEKVTVTLPRELVRYADERAAERGVSRSEVVSEAVAQRRARDIDDLAREGYAFYREESSAFAEAVMGPVSEALNHGD